MSEQPFAEALRGIRWPDSRPCPYCSSARTISNGTLQKHYHKYLCCSCRRSFNEKTGTVFEDSKLQVWEWVYIIRELEKGKSLRSISRELGRAYKNVLEVKKKAMNLGLPD